MNILNHSDVPTQAAMHRMLSGVRELLEIILESTSIVKDTQELYEKNNFRNLSPLPPQSRRNPQQSAYPTVTHVTRTIPIHQRSHSLYSSSARNYHHDLPLTRHIDSILYRRHLPLSGSVSTSGGGVGGGVSKKCITKIRSTVCSPTGCMIEESCPQQIRYVHLEKTHSCVPRLSSNEYLCHSKSKCHHFDCCSSDDCILTVNNYNSSNKNKKNKIKNKTKLNNNNNKHLFGPKGDHKRDAEGKLEQLLEACIDQATSHAKSPHCKSSFANTIQSNCSNNSLINGIPSVLTLPTASNAVVASTASSPSSAPSSSSSSSSLSSTLSSTTLSSTTLSPTKSTTTTTTSTKTCQQVHNPNFYLSWMSNKFKTQLQYLILVSERPLPITDLLLNEIIQQNGMYKQVFQSIGMFDGLEVTSWTPEIMAKLLLVITYLRDHADLRPFYHLYRWNSYAIKYQKISETNLSTTTILIDLDDIQNWIDTTRNSMEIYQRHVRKEISLLLNCLQLLTKFIDGTF